MYYCIKEDCILEREFEWSLDLFAIVIKPCRERTKTIYFDRLTQYDAVVEGFGKRSFDKTSPVASLSSSTLIFFLLGGLKSPEFFLRFEETIEYKKAIVLLEKLKSIEVSNGYLILKS